MSPSRKSDNDAAALSQEPDPAEPDHAGSAPLPQPDLDRRIERLEDSIRAEENIVSGEDGVSENELTRAEDRSNDRRGETSS